MKNFNDYNEKIFSSEFKKTDIYRKLSKDFDVVSLKKFYWNNLQETRATPRQSIGDSHTEFSAVPFYYLNFLLDRNPQQIYDLGCGWNIFKKYIPNIIGVGAEPPGSKFYHADIHDFVDNDYVQYHQDYFESVFSINALHFCPLTEFEKIVTNFYSMIKPQGRGFLALNVQRMLLEQTAPMLNNRSSSSLDTFCRSELSKLSYIKFLVVDIDFTILDEGMDGNIRLVMEK